MATPRAPHEHERIRRPSPLSECGSAVTLTEQLPAHNRKNGRTGEFVSKIASSFVAEGLAEVAPGPRGGAGWSLTKKGKALIDRADGAESFEASRGGRNPWPLIPASFRVRTVETGP